MRNSVVMNRMNFSGIHDQRYGIKDKYFWDCREQRASETFSVVCACFSINALVLNLFGLQLYSVSPMKLFIFFICWQTYKRRRCLSSCILVLILVTCLTLLSVLGSNKKLCTAEAMSHYGRTFRRSKTSSNWTKLQNIDIGKQKNTQEERIKPKGAAMAEDGKDHNGL